MLFLNLKNMKINYCFFLEIIQKVVRYQMIHVHEYMHLSISNACLIREGWLAQLIHSIQSNDCPYESTPETTYCLCL